MAKFTDSIAPISVTSSQVRHEVDNSFARLVSTFSSAVPKIRAASALKEKQRISGKEDILGAEVLQVATTTADEAFFADVGALSTDLDDFATAQVDTRSSPRQLTDVSPREFNLTPDRFNDPSDQAVFLAASGKIDQLDAAQLAGAKGIRLQMAQKKAFNELLAKYGDDPEAQRIIGDQFKKYGVSLFDTGTDIADAEQKAAQQTIDEQYPLSLQIVTEMGGVPENATKTNVIAAAAQYRQLFNTYQADTFELKKLQTTSGISKTDGEISGREWMRKQSSTFLAGAMLQSKQIIADAAASEDPELLISSLNEQHTLAMAELGRLTRDVDPREVEAISRVLEQTHRNAVSMGTKDDMLKFYETSVKEQAAFARHGLYSRPGFAETVEKFNFLRNVQMTTFLSKGKAREHGEMLGQMVSILNESGAGFTRGAVNLTPDQRTMTATGIKIQTKASMDVKDGDGLLTMLSNMVMGATGGTDGDLDSMLIDTMAYEGYIDTMRTLGAPTPDRLRTLAVIGERFDTLARAESRELRAEFGDRTVDKIFIPHQGSIGKPGTIEREDIAYDVTLSGGMPVWSVSPNASPAAVSESKMSLERLNGPFGKSLGKLVRAIAHAQMCNTDACYQSAYDSVMFTFASTI